MQNETEIIKYRDLTLIYNRAEKTYYTVARGGYSTPAVDAKEACLYFFAIAEDIYGGLFMKERWSTPQDFFDKLNAEFGFDLDVCAEDWNHKCDKYFSPDQNGLFQDWTGTVWMNPPYGREIKHWIRKAYTSSLMGATVVCLIPSRTETAWFQDYCLKGEIRFVRGRLHFTDLDGKTGRPRFGSAVVIFQPPTFEDEQYKADIELDRCHPPELRMFE